MAGASAAGEATGNYAGLLIAAGVILAVLVGAAVLWIHYHG
jgi:hypothetical protein